jgi:hypothetical protein
MEEKRVLLIFLAPIFFSQILLAKSRLVAAPRAMPKHNLHWRRPRREQFAAKIPFFPAKNAFAFSPNPKNRRKRRVKLEGTIRRPLKMPRKQPFPDLFIFRTFGKNDISEPSG